MTADEILEQRKNKFLKIGRDKGFISNPESLSTLKVKENYLNEYKVLAINRHLKVIGIFTRLFVRDNKKNYLKHIPRLWKLIEKNSNFIFLNQINEWLNEYFPKRKRTIPTK